MHLVKLEEIPGAKEELKKIDTKYEELNKQDIELEKNYKNKTYPKNE